MIEIERHIEILLLNNDCVIVPGLGGFMTHHVDARYDERDNMFLPPMRTLGFNPQLKMNDSLLAQSYIEAYDISYPEAIKRIEDEMMEIRQHLESTGIYELNDIGTLFLNSNGNIEFNPCESGILTPELYGLAGFEIDKLAVFHQRQNDEILQDIEKIVLPIKEATSSEEKKEVLANAKEEKRKSEPVYDEDDDNSLKIPLGLVRYVIAAAAAILFFFYLTSPIANSEIKGITQSSIKNGILFNILGGTNNSNTEKPLMLKKVSQVLAQKNSVSKTLAEKKSQKTNNILDEQPTKNYYCIVLASRVTETNAKHFSENMHRKGYDQTKVYIHNNNVRVIYGCYTTESQAYNVLNELHVKADEFKDSWVYKVKE